MNPDLPFDFQPTLTGDLMTLRPLVADDFESLYSAASDPMIWAQHPDPQRYQRDVFQQNFFAGAVAGKSAFIVQDKQRGAVIGSSRYYDWQPEKREIAIGFTFLVCSHWGGQYNAELKRLMLDHAFRWADTVWFHIGSHNWRSRKAMEKIGGCFSHEEVRIFNGLEYPHAFYRIDAPR